MKINYRVLFWIALLIAITEGCLIYFAQDLTTRVTLPPYSFTDLKKDSSAEKYPSFNWDSLVTAHGSWTSTEKTDTSPLSTVTIECWRDWNNCLIADSTIFAGKFLTGHIQLEEIDVWNDNYIETKPGSPVGCYKESYRLDRENQTVSQTRKKVSREGSCEGVSDEPIVSKLGDGYERLKMYRSLH